MNWAAGVGSILGPNCPTPEVQHCQNAAQCKHPHFRAQLAGIAEIMQGSVREQGWPPPTPGHPLGCRVGVKIDADTLEQA
jgi:hypothetical protein